MKRNGDPHTKRRGGEPWTSPAAGQPKESSGSKRSRRCTNRHLRRPYRLNPGSWWAINIVTSATQLYETIRQIRAIGGSGVVVTPITYIFEEAAERFQQLLATLESESVAQ